MDLGCGPGRLTLLLADRFDEVLAVDADAGMIDAATVAAAAAGAHRVRFRTGRAEDLAPADGRFDVATFGISFHWMNGPELARRLLERLRPGGACVLVHAWSLSGGPVEGGRPQPPREVIDEVRDRHLGPGWRAGLVSSAPGDGDDPLLRAGFRGPDHVPVPGGEVVTSTVDDIVARVLSTSTSSPARLGSTLSAFVADLRTALSDRAADDGRFDERVLEARLEIWRAP